MGGPEETPAADRATTAFSDALAADSRERAVRALLRVPSLRKLWTAQLTGSVADRLGVLALVALAAQAADEAQSFGGGYRGLAFAVAAVLALRVLAALLFGAVLLGPLGALITPVARPAAKTDGKGGSGTRSGALLDRRWTMIGADAVRLGLLVVAPLWIDWVPDTALAWLLVTAFVSGVAERVWTVAKDAAAPALLPAPAPSGQVTAAVPDRLDALRRLDLRTGFTALPLAAAVLIVVSLVSELIAVGSTWFDLHQVALAGYLAAGLFAASITVLYSLHLPDAAAPAAATAPDEAAPAGRTPRPRSPLEGLRLPKGPAGAERGRTGALPVLVLACAAVAASIAAAAALAVLHGADLGGGPVEYGILTLALTAGPVLGIRTARRVLPALSRRRLLSLAVAVTGVALLLLGLVPDPTTELLLALVAGYAAGVAANCGHLLIDQEAEEPRRARTTDHLHAVVRVTVAVAAVVAPVLAGVIGPHRVTGASFTFDHGGAAYTLMLVGALLLPVAALVLGKLDDREGVPFRRDLREALRGGDPAQRPFPTGFFIAVEGGDGAGKSTQVQALAEWIRGKGHEVVVTREPGATAIGKRLRSILLDVSSTGISHRAEALLYAADRAEHVDSVVRPALERGAVVISDRYIDSSVAYQGAGRDLAPTEIARISRWATGGLVPHLTVLLDVSPQTARDRFTEAPDRLESEPPEFHERVRAGFLTLAAADPTRYLVVDAGQEPDAVTRIVRHRLDQVLPLSEQEIAARAEAERKAAEEARRRAEEEAALKAEEERKERERQETLARLRAEEEERKRREIEEARRAEEARQAEEARKRAEEARRLAEEERARREAEERAYREEQERLRRMKEEQDRLRAEAEARRLEKQRKAEEALLRAEHARLAAEAARVAAESSLAPEPPAEPRDAEATRTVQTPSPSEPRPAGGSDAPGARGSSGGSGGSGASWDGEATRTVQTPSPSGPGARKASGASEPSGDETRTVETPRVEPPSGGSAGGTSAPRARTGDEATRTVEVPRPVDADETAVLPQARPDAVPAQGRPDAEETAVLPQARPDTEETTVLPQVREVPGATDETAVLPPVRQGGGDPADRVPAWLFRQGGDGAAPEAPADRTRELPVVDPAQGDASAEHPDASARRHRPRPSWAEETPLDDLPTLADELLGPYDDREDGPGRKRDR
ncbi:integral membrane protein with kinase activity [Streptantibioticus cattleyicolor NRRL 8057 = DSM 46488]|uniref:Thymidylate kinase n=2 Tax=Streptantibioticus cattleyicolor TaxID=29303 RepID=G8WQK2_STREN|nr:MULTISPECIES: dTMP kinase [Streptomycetaceae]AEW95216.1 integral membrane protein with kinase activity [Streptantibioticus cattleyicolor NRRL 8057 = DSM 46488]